MRHDARILAAICNTRCYMLRQPGARRQAITLVELIVVLLIILMLMSISTPIILYFGRSNRNVSQANDVQRALSLNQLEAVLQKAPRGIRLSRAAGPDSPLPPNPNWYNQIEFVQLRDPIATGWAQVPSLVDTTAGRRVYHSAVVSLYQLQNQELVPLQHGLTSDDEPLFIVFEQQGQTRRVMPPLGTPSLPLAKTYTYPPPAPYPQTPATDGSNEVFPLAQRSWQPAQANEWPILQSHQLYLVDANTSAARGLGLLFLQPPNIYRSSGSTSPQYQITSNFALYSLAAKSNPARTEWLKEPVVVDLGSSRPGVTTYLFAPNRSVVVPGEAGLSGNTVNGWIVLWVGAYEQLPTGSYVIRPENSVLVAIHTRTGKVASFPVNTNTTLGDYYYVRTASQN